MKKFIAVFVLVLLAACTTQKKYVDFDYSYSRSGGLLPVYENLWVKGTSAHYIYERQGKKVKKDFKLTQNDLQNIETALSDNRFRMIEEDYNKVYDRVATAIIVKKGANSGSKSDASLIRQKDQDRWNNVVVVFENIIKTNVAGESR